jgi:hypothetical protein
METEQWQPIIGPYRPGYEVSSFGRVRGSQRNKRGGEWAGGICSTRQGILGSKHEFKPGYCKVSLMTLHGKRVFVSVHRLVAIAFVAGDRSLDVNHKDMNKANNHWTNLEWVTHAQNIRHGMHNHPTWLNRIRSKAKSRSRPVISTDANGIENKYESINGAGRSLGLPNRAANIHHAVERGSIAYGCSWRYA